MGLGPVLFVPIIIVICSGILNCFPSQDSVVPYKRTGIPTGYRKGNGRIDKVGEPGDPILLWLVLLYHHTERNSRAETYPFSKKEVVTFMTPDEN